MDSIIPKHAYVEVTNYCNFKCAFCPYPYMTRRRGMMNIEFAMNIPRILRNSGITHLYIAGMGEPLLYPHLAEFIEEAGKENLYTHLFTNGYLLTRETSMKLYGAKLFSMGIGLHTPTKESFEALHTRKKSFSTYLSRIKTAIKTKIEVESPTEIKIYLMCTSTSKLFGYNLRGAINNKEQAFNEILRWYQIFEDWGIQHILNPPLKEDINPSLFNVQITPGVSVVSKLLLPWGIDHKKKIPAIIGACRGLHSEFGILYNGDVTMCCEDYEGETTLGNMKKEPLVKIFSKRFTQRSRRLLKFCIPPTAFCRRCRGGVNIKMWLATQLGSIAQHKLGTKIGGW